jgi:transcription elongation GreA/GreB family factor
MNLPNKTQVIQKFIDQIESEKKHIEISAEEAHAAATHEQLKAEDRHDTQAIEASYLAAGQVTRINTLNSTLNELQKHLEQSLNKASDVVAGALLLLETNQKKTITFLALSGGGTHIQFGECYVSITTLDSPLGQALIGAQVGDEVEVETKLGLKAYQILAIR